jgi:hypothetical protein
MAVVFLDPAPGTNDGFDAASQYQMVPAFGGIRRMALWVQPDEAEDVIVYCTDPNRAHLFGLHAIEGHAATRGSGFFVRRNSAIRFFIGGRDPGPATLAVETVGGKPRGFLLLSVKAQPYYTYQLAIISDSKHVPAKDLAGANLAANMLGAEKLWLEQANVMLARVGAINDVVVPGNLGDRIVIDDPKVLGAISNASRTSQLVQASLYIYGTWDIITSSTDLVGGLNTGNMCFIENQFGGRVGQLICAHEVGHALGLPHSAGDSRTDLLMTPFGITNDFLDMWDIETANRL